MARKINGIDDDLILLAGLGVGGYLLYKAIFPSGPSQEDSNTVNSLYTVPDNVNPLSYNFKYSLYAQNPQTYGAQWWINLAQTSANLLQNGTNPADISGVYNYVTWGEQIRSAFGMFTIDFNTVQSVFQAVNSQADVSNIACYLWFTRSINLQNLLSTGQGANSGGGSLYLGSGLSVTNMATIVNEVSNLPLSN